MAASLTVSHTLGQRWKCPAEYEIFGGADSNLSPTQNQLSWVQTGLSPQRQNTQLPSLCVLRSHGGRTCGHCQVPYRLQKSRPREPFLTKLRCLVVRLLWTRQKMQGTLSTRRRQKGSISRHVGQGAAAGVDNAGCLGGPEGDSVQGIPWES